MYNCNEAKDLGGRVCKAVPQCHLVITTMLFPFHTGGRRSKVEGEKEKTFRHLAEDNLLRPSQVMNQLFHSGSCPILVAISKSFSLEA